MLHALQGGTYKIEELTVAFDGAPVNIPPGAILVGAGHTFNGSYQLVLLVPDGKPTLQEAVPPRKGGK